MARKKIVDRRKLKAMKAKGGGRSGGGRSGDVLKDEKVVSPKKLRRCRTVRDQGTLLEGMGVAFELARSQRGMDVAAFSEESGVSQNVIYKVEAGKQNLSLMTMMKLAKASRVELSAIVRKAEDVAYRIRQAERDKRMKRAKERLRQAKILDEKAKRLKREIEKKEREERNRFISEDVRLSEVMARQRFKVGLEKERTPAKGELTSEFMRKVGEREKVVDERVELGLTVEDLAREALSEAEEAKIEDEFLDDGGGGAVEMAEKALQAAEQAAKMAREQAEEMGRLALKRKAVADVDYGFSVVGEGSAVGLSATGGEIKLEEEKEMAEEEEAANVVGDDISDEERAIAEEMAREEYDKGLREREFVRQHRRLARMRKASKRNERELKRMGEG